MPGGGGPGGSASTALITYLEANQGSDTYLVATTDSKTAASIILAADKPVMSLTQVYDLNSLQVASA